MKIIDIALKDLTRSLRSAFTIGMAVAAPLLITALLYFAFGGGGASKSVDLPAVRVGIASADALPPGSLLGQPLGETIRAMFTDDSVKSWISAVDYAGEESARAAVDRQEIGVAVIIPAGFSADLTSGKTPAPITLIQDPTLSVTPQVVRNMLTALLDGVSGGGIAYQTILARQQTYGIRPDPAQLPIVIEKYQAWYANFQRDLFHHPESAALVLSAPAAGSPQTTGIANLMGLVLAGQMIFFAFYTGAYAMLSILREQEEGTLARLFTTPTGRTTILAGKFLAVVLTVVLQGLVLMTAGRVVFGIQWGDPAAAALALGGQVAAATGLGVLLIAFVKDTRQGGPVLGGALTGLGMLGGLFTASIPNMPEAFKALANFTPQGWALKGWNVVTGGGSAADALLPFAVCLTLGILLFATGAVLFRRRFA